MQIQALMLESLCTSPRVLGEEGRALGENDQDQKEKMEVNKVLIVLLEKDLSLDIAMFPSRCVASHDSKD
ncbi:hypothetical protein J6590_010865 [Homalodisca vitripennis]|nr:hypothetical protein J6590_010865 [Homalodisca vitripennis]